MCKPQAARQQVRRLDQHTALTAASYNKTYAYTDVLGENTKPVAH
jgi:hypothetical protein